MQKALVAGGAGFIGSHLCEELLKKGYDVTCVDNLITGSKTNILEFLDNPRFTFIEQDITKEVSTTQFKFLNFDYIFHLASPASPSSKSPRSYINFPIETLLVNSEGTHNLLELAKTYSSFFVFASTSEVYGDPLESPQKESYFGNVNPNGIRSVYDEGKRFGEALSLAYFRKFSMHVRIVRIFNTFGPKMQPDDGRVVSNFINQALKKRPITIYGDGLQTRSFCYVSDLVDGIISAMLTPNIDGEVINIGNPEERTILDFAKIVQKLTNTSQIVFEKIPEGDPKKRCPDINKARKLLNFSPKVPLEEGLLKTIEYFKSL